MNIISQDLKDFAERTRIEKERQDIRDREVAEYRNELQQMTTTQFIAELNDLNYCGFGEIGGTAFDEVIRRLADYCND